MNKFKKILFVSFGWILGFIISQPVFSAVADFKMSPMYGVSEAMPLVPELNLWEKLLSIILSPIIFIVFIVFALML